MGKPETDKLISDTLLKLGSEDGIINRSIMFKVLLHEWAKGYTAGREASEMSEHAKQLESLKYLAKRRLRHRKPKKEKK